MEYSEYSNIVLSAPLQQLKDEHVSLRTDMDYIYDIAEEIEFDSGPAVGQLFATLHKLVSAFTVALKKHAKREEEGLFPMLARRLGGDDRTIEVMEFEHEKAERHLLNFLNEADQVGLTMDENDAQAITIYAIQAHATLTQHFAKEEKMLFPLAETVLSAIEKAELERLLKALSSI